MQRAMLVGEAFGVPILDLLQPQRDWHLRRHLHAHRDCADEQPHYGVDARKTGRAARHRGTEYYVLFSAVTAEQERPCALHKRIQRQSVSASKSLESCGCRLA